MGVVGANGLGARLARHGRVEDSGRHHDVDFPRRCGEVARMPCENGRGAGFQRACRDEHVVGLSADHSPSLCAVQRAPGLGRVEAHDGRLAPVRRKERNGVLGSQAIGRGQPGKDSVRFRQRVSGKDKLFAGAASSLQFRQCPPMVFVPGTDRRDEGVGIAEVSSHPAASRSLVDEAPARRLAIVSSTSADVNTARPSRGTATTAEPRCSSDTSNGTGSISIRPARTRNLTRVPGRK